MKNRNICLLIILISVGILGCTEKNEINDTTNPIIEEMKPNSETIQDKADSDMHFYDGLAYFVSDDTYGFIKEDGSIAFYLDCDSVSDFSEGMAYYSVEGRYGYIDTNGIKVIEAEYNDADFFQDGIAFVALDGYKGAIDKNGNVVISIQYDEIYRENGHICASYSNEITYFDNQGNEYTNKTDEYIEENPFKTELQNHITPKNKAFYNLVYLGETKAIGMNGEIEDLEKINFIEDNTPLEVIKTAKFYNVDNSLYPVLLYKETAKDENLIFPLSTSGIYVYIDNVMYLLLSGYECGGSLRGDYVCLYKDNEEGSIYLGTLGSTGGFGGKAVYSNIYTYQEGIADSLISYEVIHQMTNNYDEKELLEWAKLFYNDTIPYTKDTILDADYVTEYRVNEGRIDIEYYLQICEKYRKITLFE